MCRDHIVADVRRIREEIAAECGYDLKRLAERDREVAETWPGRLVSKEKLLRDRRASRAAGK